LLVCRSQTQAGFLPTPNRSMKTSICVGLKDRPGALVDLLLVFKAYGINLTRIESRPSRKRFGDYLFYLDAECDLSPGSLVGSKIQMYLEAESVFLGLNGPYVSFGEVCSTDN
jgi:prephenate dehydratase